MGRRFLISVKDYFDWYQRWICIKDILAATLRKTDLILNVGNGVSRLPEEMYDDGYEKIISIDVNANAIKFMNDKCRHKRDEFKCTLLLTQDEVMDVKNITYEHGRFDVVFDKATLDCFFVDG